MKNPTWYKTLREFDKFANLELNFNLTMDEPEENDVLENLEREIEEEIELPLQNIISKRASDMSTKLMEKQDSVWRNFVLNVLISPHVRDKIIYPERSSLIDVIKQIEDLKIENEKNALSLENFIKKLVTFLQYGIEKKLSHHQEVLINVIRLLEQILDSYPCDSPERTKMQNTMNKCNVTKTILFFLCNKTLPQIIYKSLINLSIKLLEGGNNDVQANFYDYFVSTQNSENFFQVLYNMINQEIFFINKKKSLHEKIDICLRDVKYSYKASENFSITNILKMLQLLTENHNSNLQVPYFIFRLRFTIFSNVQYFTINLIPFNK